MSVDDDDLLLEILDTANLEWSSTLRENYMRDCDGFLIVFDLISKSSFPKVSEFRELVIRLTNRKDIPIVLVGNKIDLDNRAVSYQEAFNKAAKYGYQYIETSAKCSTNVEKAFLTLVIEIMDDDNWLQKQERLQRHRILCVII